MSKMLAEDAKRNPSGYDHDTCTCGLPIIRGKFYPEDGWYHATGGERGCRAALFEVDEEAWLNSTRTTRARPRKKKLARNAKRPHGTR